MLSAVTEGKSTISLYCVIYKRIVSNILKSIINLFPFFAKYFQSVFLDIVKFVELVELI